MNTPLITLKASDTYEFKYLRIVLLINRYLKYENSKSESLRSKFTFSDKLVLFSNIGSAIQTYWYGSRANPLFLSLKKRRTFMKHESNELFASIYFSPSPYEELARYAIRKFTLSKIDIDNLLLLHKLREPKFSKELNKHATILFKITAAIYAIFGVIFSKNWDAAILIEIKYWAFVVLPASICITLVILVAWQALTWLLFTSYRTNFELASLLLTHCKIASAKE